MPSNNLDLYLAMLNQDGSLNQTADWAEPEVPAATGYNGILYQGVRLEYWQSMFRIKADTSTNVINEDVVYRTESAAASAIDLVYYIDPDSTATTNSTGVYGDNNLSIRDLSRVLNTTADPACNLDFQEELSRAIFGTPLGIDLFNNENEVKGSFGTAIVEMARNLRDTTLASEPIDGSYTGNVSGVPCLTACQTLYNQIKSLHPARFTLAYNVVLETTLADGSYSIVSAGNGNDASGAVVEIFTNAAETTITHMQIMESGDNDITGSGYTKDLSYNIIDANDNVVATIAAGSATDYQAQVFNGTFKTGGCELPLIHQDKLHVMFTVKSNPLQENAFGELLDGNAADRVSRKYLVKLTMV